MYICKTKEKNMISYTNAIEIASEKMRKGEMTAAQANVLIIQLIGVKVVSKMPSDVRKALNEAVKNGELGHIKKDGLRPEVYHHINARPSALDTRDRIAREAINNLSKVYTN